MFRRASGLKIDLLLGFYAAAVAPELCLFLALPARGFEFLLQFEEEHLRFCYRSLWLSCCLELQRMF